MWSFTNLLRLLRLLALHGEEHHGGYRQGDGDQDESVLEGEAQIVETQENDQAAQDRSQVSQGIELAQALAGFTDSGQFHADGGGKRHHGMLANAVNKQPHQ